MAVGSLLIGLIGGFYIPRQAPLGGSNFNRQVDFSEGISVDGTELITGTSSIRVADGNFSGDVVVIDEVRALGADGNKVGSGVASSVAVFTIGNSVTSTLVLGTSGEPVCISTVAFNAAKSAAETYYWYFFTTTGVEVSISKPATCP